MVEKYAYNLTDLPYGDIMGTETVMIFLEKDRHYAETKTLSVTAGLAGKKEKRVSDGERRASGREDLADSRVWEGIFELH